MYIIPPTVQNSPYATSDAIRMPQGSWVRFVFALCGLCLLYITLGKFGNGSLSEGWLKEQEFAIFDENWHVLLKKKLIYIIYTYFVSSESIFKISRIQGFFTN